MRTISQQLHTNTRTHTHTHKDRNECKMEEERDSWKAHEQAICFIFLTGGRKMAEG